MKQSHSYLRAEIEDEKVSAALRFYSFYFCKLTQSNSVTAKCNKTTNMMTFDIHYNSCEVINEYLNEDVYIINFLVPLGDDKFAKMPIAYCKSEATRILLDLQKSGMAQKLINRVLGYSVTQVRYHYTDGGCDSVCF